MTKLPFCLFLLSLVCSCATPPKQPDRPTAFIDRPVAESFLRNWEDEAESGQAWTRSPLEVAIRLWAHPAHQNDESPFTVHVQPHSETEVTVDIHEYALKDDSVYELYTRITLRRVNGALWRPVSLQEAWKGRGRTGWTIEPTI